VRPGPERAAGIDEHRDGVERRRLPRRPDPKPADDDAVVELAPCVLPSVAHRVDVDDVEADRTLVGVDGESTVELLDALREDVQEQSELGVAADDDVAVQRKALFSFSKKPSSAL
jgi:hypothetical protein